MKTFYLLRHQDVHGNSGTGVVAEGVIFDSGMCSMTWLSEFESVTTFRNIATVKRLHSHDGKTEVVIEGQKNQAEKFTQCKLIARKKKTLDNHKKEEEND
jgi:hypothetical protein